MQKISPTFVPHSGMTPYLHSLSFHLYLLNLEFDVTNIYKADVRLIVARFSKYIYVI